MFGKSAPLFLCLALLHGAVAANARPPNIILIMADDQGYADLGCYGGEHVETPRLDRLAEEGLRLTQFYQAANLCTPSRAGLLTGRYPARFGLAKGVIFPRHTHGLPPEEVTLAEILQSAGYRTGMIGKWHLGHEPELLPTAQGFDTYFGVPYSNDMARQGAHSDVLRTVPGLDLAWAAHDLSSEWWNVPLMRNTVTVEQPTDQRLLTRRYTDEALGFIKRHREEPFFLYLAHSMPHVPLFVEPEHYTPDVAEAYRRVIAELDASTGQIVDLLRALELADDTILIYTSDNGPWLGKKHHAGLALPLREGKMTTFEGGHRVPFILWAPGRVAADRVGTDVVTSLDLLPTLSTLAGAQIPHPERLDGLNVADYLLGKPQDLSDRPPYFYFSNRGVLEGIRDGPWKLLDRGTETLLFNLEEDPGEESNLFAERPLDVMRLSRQLAAFRAALEPTAVVPQP